MILVFCLKTTKTIKIYFFKNFPSNEKLKETIRSNLKRRKIRINNEAIKSNLNPPKKNNQNNKIINILSLNMRKEKILNPNKSLKIGNIISKTNINNIRGIKSKKPVISIKKPKKENNNNNIEKR